MGYDVVVGRARMLERKELNARKVFEVFIFDVGGGG